MAAAPWKSKTRTSASVALSTPDAALKLLKGGNWNVVATTMGCISGQAIVVDSCSGVRQIPKVTVNVIDFHGTGI